MPLTTADIENHHASAEYKRGLLKYEPWKVMTVTVCVTAIVFGALGGIVGYLLADLLIK